MLSWLDRLWNAAASTVGQAVSSAVHWTEHAIMSVVLSVFRLVGGAWNYLADAFRVFHSALDHWSSEVFAFADYLIHHLIPSILRWAERELAKLAAFISRVYDDLQRAVNNLILRIASTAEALTKWVLRNIYDPLKEYADQIWADLKKWGYYAYWYITHPAALAEVIIFPLATSLEKHAWQLAGQLGKFALSLVLANIKPFIHLIEDVIDSVL